MQNPRIGGRGRGGCNLGMGRVEFSNYVGELNGQKSAGKGSANYCNSGNGIAGNLALMEHFDVAKSAGKGSTNFRNFGHGSARNLGISENLNASKGDGKGNAISDHNGYKYMQNWSVLTNPTSPYQSSEFSDFICHGIDNLDPSNHILDTPRQISEFSEPFHQISELSNPTKHTSKPFHQISEISEPLHQISRFSEPFHQISEISEPLHQISTFLEPFHQISEFSNPTEHISEPFHQISEFSEPFHQISEFSEPFRQISEFSSPTNHISNPLPRNSNPIHQISVGTPYKKAQRSTPVANQGTSYPQKTPKPPTSKKKKALDLFSGSGSVAHALREEGYEVYTLDINPKCGANWQVDVLEWPVEEIYRPGFFHLVAASPPCTEYSTAMTCRPRNFDLADSLVRRTIQIIEYLRPPMWWIENPRHGKLSTRDVIAGLPYIDIDFCRFSTWGYQKPTRFWCSQNIASRGSVKCEGRCSNLVPAPNGGLRHKYVIGNRYREGPPQRYKQVIQIPANVVHYLTGFFDQKSGNFEAKENEWTVVGPRIKVSFTEKNAVQKAVDITGKMTEKKRKLAPN